MILPKKTFEITSRTPLVTSGHVTRQSASPAAAPPAAQRGEPTIAANVSERKNHEKK